MLGQIQRNTVPDKPEHLVTLVLRGTDSFDSVGKGRTMIRIASRKLTRWLWARLGGEERSS